MSKHNKLRIVLVIVVALALILAFMMSPKEPTTRPVSDLVPRYPLTVSERQVLERGVTAKSVAAGEIVKKDPVTERNRRDLDILFNTTK